MTDEEKKVALTLDEMAIQPSLDYDQRCGDILGLPTIPDSHNQQCDTLATHAMVFMIRGLSTPWKQAVAYDFTGSSWSSSYMKEMIFKVIKETHKIGLDVKSVTMDMGGGNQGILRDLGITCSKTGVENTCPHPVVPGTKLHFFPDVPHLLKNVRNHLSRGQEIYMPANIVDKNNLPTHIVSLTSVEKLVTIDEAMDLKLVPRLKISYLNPGHFEKMKVNPAVTLISRSTAAALRILVEQGLLSNDALTTAWFFEQIAMWYDLMTSRSLIMAMSKFSEEKCKATETFLTDFIKLITDMNIGETTAAMKPVQKGMIIATLSAINVKDILLNNDNFAYVLMSGFTQDCLENLFSMIRYKNPVPTALEFKNALRVIAITQLLKCKDKGNYQIDPNVEIPGDDVELVLDADHDARDEPIENKPDKKLSDIENMSLYNLAGYCVHQFIKLNRHCTNCKEFLITKERPALADLTIEKCYSVDCLTFASRPVFEICKIAEQVIYDLGNDVLKRSNVLELLIKETITRSSHLEFPDCHDVASKIVNKYCKVRVFSYLKQCKHAFKKKMKFHSQANGSRSLAMRERVQNVKLKKKCKN